MRTTAFLGPVGGEGLPPMQIPGVIIDFFYASCVILIPCLMLIVGG